MSHEVGASSSPLRRLLLSTIASALTPSAPSHSGNVGGLAHAAIYSRVLRASGPPFSLQRNNVHGRDHGFAPWVKKTSSPSSISSGGDGKLQPRCRAWAKNELLLPPGTRAACARSDSQTVASVVWSRERSRFQILVSITVFKYLC
jgi:hypothetical protein